MFINTRKNLYFLFLILISILSVSCNQGSSKAAKTRPSFKAITGIRFIEVRRTFANGLSFNKQGYQLEPEWVLYFTSDDSVRIYHPKKEKFIHYPIYYDHDSVFNFTREWLRVKKISKDSLVLQRLEVNDKIVSNSRSNVYMTFYSEDHYREALAKHADGLKKPNRQDTLYIKSKVKRANRNPDSAFAARNPVVLKSKSPKIKVRKVEVEVDSVNINNVYAAYSYLYPEYVITINKAYKDFNYYYSVVVDENGKITFRRLLTTVSPEFEETKKRIAKGITDVYLQNLLEIIPGNTLGFPHASVINVQVKGRKR